jgi:hypothetical protein
MMRAIGLLALLAVLDVGAANAQLMGAPTGHRQPTAGDVGDEKKLLNPDPNDPLTKENRALDQKINSICRGCEDEQTVRGKHKKGRRHPDTAAQH